MHRYLSIQKEDILVDEDIKALKLAGVGAVVSFLGIVRDYSDNQSLIALNLEHYPEMTESEIDKIIDEAAARWPLFGVRIIHRVGRLLPTDNIVFVGTASAHRNAAFESADFIMDFLKTKAPFWKKEETTKGAHWVQSRDIDLKSIKRWDNALKTEKDNF